MVEVSDIPDPSVWAFPLIKELQLLRQAIERTNEQPEKPSPPLTLTVEEVAERLGRSKSRVYELCATGEMRSFRDGRSMRIPADEPEKWLKRKLSQR